MSKKPKENSLLSGVKFVSSSTYTFKEAIAHGGMGVLYLAEKSCGGFTTTVVLKTVYSLEQHKIEKLKKEANIATKLNHENIINTQGVEVIKLSELPDDFKKQVAKSFEQSSNSKNRPSNDLDTVYFIVMDYIQGYNLHDVYLEHKKSKRLLPIAISAFIVSRIARALAYAHKHIIHRDITINNIIIDNNGVTKLFDFGLASTEIKNNKSFSGSINFAAPEHIIHNFCDHRSDIYSLGVLFYLLLTGVNLFATIKDDQRLKRIQHVKDRHKNFSIPPPQNLIADIPPVLGRIVMKMMHKNPNIRYQNAIEIVDMIEQKYLYINGFGPTNSMLKAYLDFVNIGYDDRKFSNEQKIQLLALSKFNNQIGQKKWREGGLDKYTEEGKKLIDEIRKETHHNIVTP